MAAVMRSISFCVHWPGSSPICAASTLALASSTSARNSVLSTVLVNATKTGSDQTGSPCAPRLSTGVSLQRIHLPSQMGVTVNSVQVMLSLTFFQFR